MRPLFTPTLAMSAALALAAPVHAADAPDATPRTLLLTAFPPEFAALEGAVEAAQKVSINGHLFLSGTLAGHPVLLAESGVSMVNAASTTQLALDRFRVRRVVFSGIAGGVDPALHIGDVAVPERWVQPLETAFARATKRGWQAPEPRDPAAPPGFGMMVPRAVRVGNAQAAPQRHYQLPADPALLALAQQVSGKAALARCTAPATGSPKCLPATPRVVVGGVGASASVLVDNAQWRRYLQRAWHARLTDMESAAVVQVAYANRVPVIVFRSLSDLAGGDAGENQMRSFMALAAGNSASVVKAFVAALPD
jgi:adenosylhomocysteine nucleosidase